MLSAWRAGRWLDRGLTVLSLIGVSMPVFFLGAVLSYYLGDKLEILPAGGLRDARQQSRGSGSST